VLLDIGEFVHVSGAFSFRIGEVEMADVNTGIVSDVPAHRPPTSPTPTTAPGRTPTSR
jgi:hypothetical protein